MPEHGGGLARLEADGLLQRVDGRLRTSRRWQGAMARAALCLYERQAADEDLRVPIAYALIELYGDELGDVELAGLIEAMAPIEAAELDPRGQREQPARPA